MNNSLQLNPTKPQNLGMYVIAPAQHYLEPIAPSISQSTTSLQNSPIQTAANDGFCLGILSALGLPCELHIAVEGAVLSKEAIEDPQLKQENLTTQAVSTKPAWMAAFSALDLNKKKLKSNEPVLAKPVATGIKFH